MRTIQAKAAAEKTKRRSLNRSTVAQMAERVPHTLKVVGSNPASGSYENVFPKLK